MNNETGLDWMARNVHVWPDGMREVLVCYPRNVNALIWSCVSSNAGWITKEQWITRRAELQNKPSWDDFGESAKFMAQDSDGAWMAFESEPAANYHVWSSTRGWCGYAREGRDRCRGEVLGDWRDTLERRPQAEADITDPFDPEFRSVTVSNETIPLEQPVVVASIGDAIQGKCPSCGNTGIHACLGRKVTHTDTANEITKWVAKQQAKETSDWHERGELPPVGARCVALLGIAPKANCEVIAKTEQQMVVKWEDNGMMDVIDLDVYAAFRPTLTEREVAIEEMCQVAGLDGLMFGLVAGKLYDAGYRKESK